VQHPVVHRDLDVLVRVDPGHLGPHHQRPVLGELLDTERVLVAERLPEEQPVRQEPVVEQPAHPVADIEATRLTPHDGRHLCSPLSLTDPIGAPAVVARKRRK